MLSAFYKIILISIVLLFFGAKTVGQTVSFPQETMLLRIEKIAEIAKETGKSITYETQFLQGITARTLTSQSADVEVWLRASMENTPLTYRKINDSRFVIIRNLNEKRITGTLAGKITDTFGTPLAEATIFFRNVQKGTTAGMNGDYTMTLTAGTYAAEIRFLGFETIHVEQIEIRKGEIARLDVALKESKTTLNEIEISRKSSESTVLGALRVQRSTPYISTVLSSQEISRSAANSLFDALKLIPGIATDENDNLAIRGADGRWNEILLDGTPLPNYASAYKLFSFDLLPLSAVENIRILKSTTPDIPVGLGNAITEIVTKDIPEHNFVQLKTEYRFNTQSTFKNQRGRKRGKWDFLGMDDGSRKMKMPFSPQHFDVYDQITPLSQHYAATIGRACTPYNGKHRLGLIFSLSYGNTQQQQTVHHTERGRWGNIGSYTGNHDQSQNSGHTYGYQTAIGAMLNVGWQWRKNRVGFRNIFSRSFENNLTEISQHLEDIPVTENNISRQFFNYPSFSTLIQSKLEGQHGVKNVLLKWNVSHTLVKLQRKDAAFSELYKPMRDDSLAYFLHRNPTLKALYPASGGWYANAARNFRLGVSATFPFHLENTKSCATIGYSGNYGNIRYAYSETLYRYENKTDIDNPESPVFQEFEQEEYRKAAIRHFPFLMLEHRWSEKLRVVWGAQGNYESIATKGTPKWYLIPSLNVSYNTPVPDLNVRASYQHSVIRPQLSDYIPFPLYDSYLLGTSVNRPIEPSFVQSFDFRVEKQMGAFDVFSFGLFYRNMQKPIERTTIQYRQDERMYVLQNSDHAHNYGMEAQLRKQLDFWGANSFSSKIHVSAACVITRSSVCGKRVQPMMNENGETEFVEMQTTQTRPLSGQMPYQLNAGIHYADNKLFVNLTFNRNGRRLFLLGEKAHAHEYRAPFNSLEASIGYRFPKSGILLKLSGINLFNTNEIFYTNTPDDYIRDGYNFPTDNLLPRKTENYDKGRDPIIHETQSGRTFTFSVSRTF